jgi:hypothetical protein
MDVRDPGRAPPRRPRGFRVIVRSTATAVPARAGLFAGRVRMRLRTARRKRADTCGTRVAADPAMVLAHGFPFSAPGGTILAFFLAKAVVYYVVFRTMGDRSAGREIPCALLRSAMGLLTCTFTVMLAVSLVSAWAYYVPLWGLRALAWYLAWQGTCRAGHGAAGIVALGLAANALIDLACWPLLNFCPGFGVVHIDS